MSDDRLEPVPWLDSEERATWMTLTTMIVSLSAAIDGQLKRDSGLSFFEYAILSALSQPENHAMQMSNLATLAGGSRSRLSHAVTRLERQGLVQRRTNTTNETRCVEAVLTAEGLAVIEAASPDHVREARRLVFDRLNPAQVRHLQRIAHELAEAASPEAVKAVEAVIEQAAKTPAEEAAEPARHASDASGADGHRGDARAGAAQTPAEPPA
ncbi:MarR family winged helix-turn-helix transcriptional regulator [Actinoplanes solisilvae]|uniref:MarR family winged helix-turn-helix transcriptional regulator n=1 Tax=Actinoplanes solisilvae TaxID=2486853 RepID=UPI000FD81194|nr:MarR family transcriptional regulator [Actinoplanes solisilvae]